MKKYLLTFVISSLLISCSENKGKSGTQNIPDDELHEWIKEFVIEFNKDTPRNIDENTVLVTHRWSTQNKRRIIYVLKLPNIDKNRFTVEEIQEFKELTRESNKNFYCTQPVTEPLRDFNSDVEYNYSDSKNIFLFSNVIYPSDCTQP
mgnify:CR=1 FL=1